jgi:hypothetical protein
MDWKMFLGGVSMLLLAAFIRVMSKWAYSKESDYGEDYTYYRRLPDRAAVIIFSIVGLIVIFVALTTAL